MVIIIPFHNVEFLEVTLYLSHISHDVASKKIFAIPLNFRNFDSLCSRSYFISGMSKKFLPFHSTFVTLQIAIVDILHVRQLYINDLYLLICILYLYDYEI